MPDIQRCKIFIALYDVARLDLHGKEGANGPVGVSARRTLRHPGATQFGPVHAI